VTGLENPYLSVTVAISGIIISIIALHYNRKQTFAAEKSISIAQEGLKNGLIEQLRGAVDQLGNEKLEIRLGGIYALERISNESEKDYWPIMEILTAYVRMNSIIDKDGNKLNSEYISADAQTDKRIRYSECDEDDPIVEPLSIDVQAILTILGKHKRVYNSEEAKHLNLSYTYLGKAELEGAHPEGVNLEGAHLIKANLKRAHLEGTNLHRANLCHADLDKANLKRANLKWAHIRGSLIEANLDRANLEGARLMVDLKGANLKRANLKWARIKHSFFDGGANLEEADLEGAHLEWTCFEGANFKEVNLEGAQIICPEYLSFDQLSKVKTLYNTKLDEYYIPLKKKCPALFENPHNNK